MAASWRQQAHRPGEPRLLSLPAVLLVNFLVVYHYVIFFLGLGAFAAGILILSGEIEEEWWPNFDQYDIPGGNLTVGIAALVIGVAAAAYAGWSIFRHPGATSDRYLLRRAQRIILERPERVVQPDDPDAFFTEVVPRERQTKLALESATDVGFLKADRSPKRLYFEGGNERWRIPGEAIKDLQLEAITAGMANAPITIEFLSIQVEKDGSIERIDFRPRVGVGASAKTQGRQKMLKLLFQIDLLRPRDQQQYAPQARREGVQVDFLV